MSRALTLQIEPELASLLREAVATGEYASEKEIVEAALQSWAGDRMIAALGAEQVRQMWSEGLASGPGAYADIEEIKTAARGGSNG